MENVKAPTDFNQYIGLYYIGLYYIGLYYIGLYYIGLYYIGLYYMADMKQASQWSSKFDKIEFRLKCRTKFDFL